jgi:hypothetical protein
MVFAGRMSSRTTSVDRSYNLMTGEGTTMGARGTRPGLDRAQWQAEAKTYHAQIEAEIKNGTYGPVTLLDQVTKVAVTVAAIAASPSYQEQLQKDAMEAYAEYVNTVSALGPGIADNPVMTGIGNWLTLIP